MKYLLALFMLVSVAFAGDACLVKSNLSSAQDTLYSVKVTGSMSADLACVTNTQLKNFLIADSGYPACMNNLKVTKELVDTLVLRGKYADSSYIYAKTSATVGNMAIDTLKKVLAYTSTIDSNSRKIRTLTEEKLKRCEDATPSLVQQAVALTGAFAVGFLAALLVVVAVK
jgi:hypothetical protein